MIPYDHALIKTNGVNLHVVQAGPKDGELVILLHGFPDFWYGWHKQIDFLAEQGYCVWAPDQRGYNISEKPNGIAAYNLNELAADVIGLIDAAGRESAILVGHDLGAGVGWWMACKYPERLSKMVILNVPHHNVFQHELSSNPSQMLKSWYFLFFQLPIIPETLIGLLSAAFARGMQASARPGAFTDTDMVEYQKAWGQPGARTSMINWYRAVVQKIPKFPDPRIKIPTLILWGKKDPYLVSEMAQDSLKYCDDGKLIYFDEATHWIQHDEPDRVNQLMLEFFKNGERTSE